MTSHDQGKSQNQKLIEMNSNLNFRLILSTKIIKVEKKLKLTNSGDEGESDFQSYHIKFQCSVSTATNK
jgi:hypothetical protein